MSPPGEIRALGLATSQLTGARRPSHADHRTNRACRIRYQNPLTRRLSERELNFLQVIARPRLEWGGAWPVWDFVERTMYKESEVDARTILNGLPRLKERFAISGYGLVHPTVWDAPHTIPTDPNDRLQLTVAGLSQLGGQSATSRVIAIVEIVADLASLESSVRPDPSKPVTTQSSWQGIRQTLSTMMDRQISTPRRYSPEWPASVESILRHEPVMWRCNGEGEFDLHSDFRYFRGLATDDVGADYLDRTWQYFEPPEPVTLPEPVSSLAVHEALDYLRHLPSAFSRPCRTSPAINAVDWQARRALQQSTGVR